MTKKAAPPVDDQTIQPVVNMTLFDTADSPITPPTATRGEIDAIIALLKALHGRSGMHHAEIVRTEKAIRTLRGEA